MALTREAVLALAPDASAAKSGSGLAHVATWQQLGRNAQALWGLCQGSGANPYQTKVSLEDLSASCSCPSRKFPCKHGLGLMLLYADNKVPETAAPSFAQEWLDKRQARVEKKAEKAAEEKTPEAIAKAAERNQRRAENRVEIMRAAAAELQIWLNDILEVGLASTSLRSATLWNQRYKRLIDGQMPGIVRLLKQAETALHYQDFVAPTLGALAQVQLALDAFARLETLPLPMQADVLRTLGVPQKQVDIDASLHLRDHWYCLATELLEEEDLQVRRTWLYGQACQEIALVLQFGAGGQPPTSVTVAGQNVELTLAFYPGSVRQRAALIQHHGPSAPVSYTAQSLPAVLAAFSRAKALDPWFDALPCILRGALHRKGEQTLLLEPSRAHRSVQAGQSKVTNIWQHLAHSRGAICDWFCTFDGERLRVYEKLLGCL
jgi:hypothetical protein